MEGRDKHKQQKYKTTKRKYKIKKIYEWRVFLNSEKTYTNLFQAGNCFPFHFRTSCIVFFFPISMHSFSTSNFIQTSFSE